MPDATTTAPAEDDAIAAADAGSDITVEEVDAALALVSRDETQDSIDPATGTLTAEAIARRAELAAES